MAGYYDPNKDYSLAIVNAQKRGATKAEIKQLQQERQNKIDAKYGGVDPYKGTSNIMGTSGGGNQSTKPPLESNSGTGYESFQDFLDGMGYEDYTDQTQKYIQAAVENAVKGYENQIDAVNRDTQEMARQAYIANMMGQKNMDQQLAASGLAGGMADSQKIAIQANYENNLNNIERERQETVKELQLAVENAKLTGDMQTAQELSNYLQQMQSRWYDYTQNQMAMENQNYWNNMELEAENKNTARNWALTLIQNGTMPDETTLTAAGMTAADARSLLNYMRQQNTPKAVEPEPVKYTETQANTALLALMAGSDDEKARAIVESYYGMPAETVINAYGEPTIETEPSDADGMKTEYYKTYKDSILQTAKKGYENNAASMVDAIWNQLNAEQRQDLQNKLAAMGMEYQP